MSTDPTVPKVSVSPAVIVTGHLMVDPGQRDDYLAGCVRVVELGRAAPGCLDFAISADLTDPGRINVLEVWTSQDAVDRFRGEGTPEEQLAVLLSADVDEHDVVATRPLT